jgi:RNA recognition motif-containing protein
MSNRLYVGNLPYTFADEELRGLFGQAGNVAEAIVIKDRDTGQSRGFGFVEMVSSAEAENAVRTLDGYTADNRQLRVSPARERETVRSSR